MQFLHLWPKHFIFLLSFYIFICFFHFNYNRYFIVFTYYSVFECVDSTENKFIREPKLIKQKMRIIKKDRQRDESEPVIFKQ